MYSYYSNLIKTEYLSMVVGVGYCVLWRWLCLVELQFWIGVAPWVDVMFLNVVYVFRPFCVVNDEFSDVGYASDIFFQEATVYIAASHGWNKPCETVY